MRLNARRATQSVMLRVWRGRMASIYLDGDAPVGRVAKQFAEVPLPIGPHRHTPLAMSQPALAYRHTKERSVPFRHGCHTRVALGNTCTGRRHGYRVAVWKASCKMQWDR